MKSNRRSVPRIAVSACTALSALLGACVGPVQAPLPPAPATPRPLPSPPQVPIDWHDMPATPGVWQWSRAGRLSVARFGEPVLFSLTCNPLASTIGLRRAGVPGSATTMTILTTSSSRALAIQPGDNGPVAILPARDPLLDALAYSRGRFAVQVPGTTSLYLPSWPEVSRVIEDCRARPATPFQPQ